jgi:hypothetical protein
LSPVQFTFQSEQEHNHRLLRRVTDTTGAACGPILPGISTPAKDHLGTVEVRGRITGSLAPAAGSPVHVVDLPQANIITSTCPILVRSIGISSAFLGHNALATALFPSRIFGAPSGSILIVGGCSTGAASARTRAVSTTGGGGGVHVTGKGGAEEEEEGHEDLEHLLRK